MTCLLLELLKKEQHESKKKQKYDKVEKMKKKKKGKTRSKRGLDEEKWCHLWKKHLVTISFLSVLFVFDGIFVIVSDAQLININMKWVDASEVKVVQSNKEIQFRSEKKVTMTHFLIEISSIKLSCVCSILYILCTK